MKDKTQMKPVRLWFVIACCLLLVVIPLGCNTPPDVLASPLVLTVVSTVEVEVTRLIEVPSTVIVTEEVVITQLVEVPVTVTLAPIPLHSPTLEPTPTPTWIPFTPVLVTPVTPTEKGNGYAPLRVENQTRDRLTIEVNGPTLETYILGGEDAGIKFVRLGDYSYKVWKDSQVLYFGEFRINSIDKYTLSIREGHVAILYP